jgi:hypothetical protein
MPAQEMSAFPGELSILPGKPYQDKNKYKRVEAPLQSFPSIKLVI